ncbi:glycoside hydrolase family 16 protein [Polychaeton citri CBS 116435]|uniref:endo-1,3(4)-beta-glucanase n=1 Tax=Polychaeton citri CBS 116435 TaxID=1314669 RepID=A0A9P4UMS4_9PEZI|nr:glycoside hydrolase family 16 protein [Polychaeton citri CBS 116435]
MPFSTLVAGLALMSTTGWAQYTLEDDYLANGFFDQFSFFTSGDPTHGFVQYVDQGTANSNGLISSSGSQAVMRVDSTNTAPNGRTSVRLTSNKAYDSGLVIADIAHMPGGICGVWPAFWMVGPNWPSNGEIDIIEGVNDQSTNDMTLHTSDGCSIGSGGMSGYVVTSNCYINAPGQSSNQGCQIGTGDTSTYGSGFNANGGGVYATEFTSSGVKIFFFPRGSIPGDISSGSPNPSSWGQPVAYFQGGGCDFGSHIKQQQIVFDTTFCGDWAGAVWGNGGCASRAGSCNDFVANNPSAFSDAYWAVNGLKVYQNYGSTSFDLESPPSNSSASSSSASVLKESKKERFRRHLAEHRNSGAELF